jgi:hypothetical protein
MKSRMVTNRRKTYDILLGDLYSAGNIITNGFTNQKSMPNKKHLLV